MSNRTEVAAAVEQLATTLEAQVEDLTIIVDDGFSEQHINGVDVAKHLTEGEDESEDTPEGGDEQSPTETEDEEEEQSTTEDTEGEVHFEEMETVDLQKLASEKLEEYPGNSRSELVEALQDNIGDVADINEVDEDDIEDVEEEEDTTEGGESEDEPEHPEDADNPTQENYVFHFGTCSEEDCSYGANGEEADYCASHQGSSSSSKKKSSTPEESNADKVGEVKDLFEVSQLEAEAVVFQVSEGNYDSHSEAVKNHL